MASEDIYKLLNVLAMRPNGETNTTAATQSNGQRLAAVQELGLLGIIKDDEVLKRLENIASADEDTAVRVAATKAIATIFNRDPESKKQDLAKRLRPLLANDREEVCEQAANALAELGTDGKDAVKALWARLGAASHQPTVCNSIARAILMIESNAVDDKKLEGENPLLAEAFDQLASPDPQARRAGVVFLKTNVGWHLLMRSEDKGKVQKLLSAFRAVYSRDLLVDIIRLIVDVTPGYAKLFDLFDIGIPAAIFESGKNATTGKSNSPSDPDKNATTGQPVPSSSDSNKNVTTGHTNQPSDSYIVPWKQAIFLVDPRVRNFVNENILKRRVRLEVKCDTNWFGSPKKSDPREEPKSLKGETVKIIDRSPHANWFQIERQDGSNGWIDATTELTPVVVSLIDESGLDKDSTPHILRCRYKILSLMLGELQDRDKDVCQNMIAWLRECDQYFIPQERMLLANALWECVLQHGQGLRAYAAIDLRNEEDAMQEAVEQLVYSNVDETMIGVVGGLLLTEGARELDMLYEKPATQDKAETPKDYPHKSRIMPFILGALESTEEQVCQLALVWVYRRASGGKLHDDIPGPFIRDLLTRMRRLADESPFPNVRTMARNALIPITEKHSTFLFKQFDKKGALAIDVVNELVDMNSPAVMSSLIRQWAHWIAETDKGQLVDATALQLRDHKSAVLPLVERLRDPLRFDDHEEVDLKVKALHQKAPIYANQLSKLLLSDEERKEYTKGPVENKATPESSQSDASATSPNSTPPPKLEEPKLNEWMKSLVDKGGKYSELDQTAKDNKWDDEKIQKEFAELYWREELKHRKLLARQRIALQLAQMSSPRFFESGEYKDGTSNPTYIGIKSDLKTHAVPYLAHKLPEEPDLIVREHLARTLANVGELEAVDALALAIVADDRTKANRQAVLAEYYLEPSRRRSDQAAKILTGAVNEAKHTMWLIQILSVATFALGVAIVAGGLYLAFTGQSGSAEKLFGLFASIGGIAGIITLLIKGPLNDIQSSIANLVQLETAFTNFIWELNLNSTYIQSQYVQEGVIANDVVSRTIDRMESAMSTAMNVIALYTEEGRQRVFAHINALLPGSGGPGDEITVMGHYLKVEDGQKQDSKRKIMVVINHKRTDAEITSWGQDHVTFKLKNENLPDPKKDAGPIMISLIVDGVETNALPFEVTKTAGPEPNAGQPIKMSQSEIQNQE